MNTLISGIAGVALFAGALWMLTDKVSTRIRNSSYWPLGWLAFMFALSAAGRLLMPLVSKFDIKDEQAVPLLLGALFAVFVVSYGRMRYQIWKARKALEA